MIRIFIVVFFILLVSSATYWLSLVAGNVKITALGYEVEMSIAIASLFLFFFFITLMLLITILKFVVALPKTLIEVVQQSSVKNQQKKITELLINFIINNKVQAIQLAKDLESTIKNIRLKTALKYIIVPTNNAAYSLMELAKFKDLQIPASLELTKFYISKTQYSLALNHALELWKTHKTDETLTLLIECYLKLKQWQNALDLVDSMRSNMYLSSSYRKTIKQQIHYNIALLSLNEGDLSTAEKYALSSCRSTDYQLKYALLIIEIYSKQKEVSKAINIIHEAWIKDPHFELARYLFALDKKHKVEKFLETAKKICAETPEHYESHLLLAKAALDADQFELASHHLSEALENKHRLRACLLMADFCQRTHKNAMEVSTWLSYAIAAENDIAPI